MVAHKTQAAFLTTLIACEDGEESRQLHEKLVKTGRESKCVCRTLFAVLMLLLLSVAGLSYCAILLPRVFSDSTNPIVWSLSILGFASSICLLELIGYLLWQRFAVARLHKECRLRVLLLVERHIRASLSHDPPLDSRQESGASLASAPIQQTVKPSPQPL
jgi:hypothetical protein